jgi:rhodanese-related sulfurtransferase
MRPALRRGALAALLLSGIGAGFYYSRFLDIDEMLRMAGAYSEAAPIAFVAAYLAMLPGAAAYTYLGYAGREAFSGADNLLRHGLIAVALLAGVMYLPRVIRRLRSARWISSEELERRLQRKEPLTIVDVRGEDEYRGEHGHLPGALNIPLPSLPARVAELMPAREQPLVLVCRTDKRSAKAAQLLRSAGFGKVEVLRGGMTEWSARG